MTAEEEPRHAARTWRGVRRSGANSDRDYRLELVASVMLAITTVLTAWSAYQATRWSGLQSINFARAASYRVESTRAYNLGAQKYVIDTSTFNFFAEAYAAGDAQLADFYRTRMMRKDFIPFVDAWIASNPLEQELGSATIRSPVEDPAYLDLLFARSRELEALAEEHFGKATTANQHSDNYVLGTVIFASVLFFAGISSKFRTYNVRMLLLALAGLMLLIGAGRIVGLPVH